MSMSSRRFPGVAALALIAGLMWALPAAHAATGHMRGAEMAQGFGRIVLQFDEAPRTAARVANGILILNFDKAATVATDRILKEMPSYLTVVRSDPDGKGMRFALTRPYRVNVTEAGERVYVDLLPETWQGLPPSLPQEVLEELTQRVRSAEAKARDVQRAREKADPKPITVRAARLPSLTRLIFEAPSILPIGHRVEGQRIDIAFDESIRIDPAKIRALLPEGVQLVRHEEMPGSLKIAVEVPPDWTVRGFREDDGLMVDLSPPRQKASPEALEVKSSPSPAKPDARAAAIQPEAAPAAASKPSEVGRAAAPEPVVAEPPSADTLPGKVAFTSSTEGGGQLDLTFTRPSALAGIEQDGRVYLVADSRDEIEPAALNAALKPLALTGEVIRHGQAAVIRIELPQPRAARLASAGNRWTLTFGDRAPAASAPVSTRRGFDDNGQTNLSASLKNASGVHWIDLDGSGVQVAVVTASGGAQALMKPYRFVDFELPQTMSGVVVRPKADDIVVRYGVGDVSIGRQGGLTLSLEDARRDAAAQKEAPAAALLSRQRWAQARQGSVRDRWRDQMRQMADLSRGEKTLARLDLVEFLLANELTIEALGPLRAALADDPGLRNDKRALLLLAAANALLERDKEAMAALDHIALREDAEGALWRALIDARAGRFGRAHGGFRRGAEVLEGYPDILQGQIGLAAARAAIEQRDFTVAQREIQRLSELGGDIVPRQRLQLVRAMAEEAAGRIEQAMAGYKELFDSASRPIAAEAQFRGALLALRENHASLPAEEALTRLETVSMIWRGGEIEARILGELGRIYGEAGRWREAFQTAKNANSFFPEHAVTRQLHDRTAQMFEELFASDKGDRLPRVETLALFYDFKQFMPIGRRGDEVIRRLADRLVELDLLDQAADLLQHQVDNRLQGAAKATVAARLAMIRLMNRRPSEALSALANSRLPELPADVRRARLLLEAKALSDLSRTDVALEILTGEQGAEIDRLRADIFWQGRRWREAGETHERMLGDVWRGREPLKDSERLDTMRAAIAYVMAEEPLALDRLRTKFAARMAESPDARTFAFITGLDRKRPSDLRDLARSVAGADTVTEFMKEYRKRYPDFASSLRQKGEGEDAGKAPPKSPDSSVQAPAPEARRPG